MERGKYDVTVLLPAADDWARPAAKAATCAFPAPVESACASSARVAANDA